MSPQLPPTLSPGDRVAVLSPSWCAPAAYPALHEQAMRRVRDLLELEPVEFPTTRRQGTLVAHYGAARPARVSECD